MSKFIYETDPSNRRDGRFWGRLNHYALDTLGITTGIETHFIPYQGRRVAVQVSGHPEGTTIYLIQGTPGSRDDPSIDAPYLVRKKLQVVTFDRGGYEYSDPIPGRRIAESAKIVQHIADYLGKPPEYVIGRSGGASGAISCSELPNVKRVAALVPLAPRKALGNSWYDDMTQFNVDVYKACEHFPDAAAKMLDEEAQKIIERRQTKFDLESESNHHRKMRSARAHAKALRFGIQGWLHDDIAAISPWDYDPTNLQKPVETLIWCAGKDIYAGPQHGEWLASNIPGAQLHVEPDAQHSTAMEILPEVVDWCLTGEFHP